MMNKVTFEYCGLDKENNFLQAPICPCGCGNYMSLILKDEDDVFSFMHTMLEEDECNHCAIFVLKNDGYAFMGVKLDGDVQCYLTKNKAYKVTGWKDIFKDIQDEFEFHCYGLLEQVDEESYRIVME